jgi:thiosulfate/3-mercaptopyruvate sulfurtransferase
MARLDRRQRSPDNRWSYFGLVNEPCKLGQQKVSIFTDSLESVDVLDRMSRKGFGVTKEATVVGRPQKPADMAVMPVSYVASARDGVVTGSEKSAPVVFIASGAAMPSRRVDGKVIHVPYTDLLNADGMPKAAKDIWAVLAKAGVPRYAGIVTFSDDPSEAAVNYYALKLMGFTDVKVLLP